MRVAEALSLHVDSETVRGKNDTYGIRLKPPRNCKVKL